MPSLSLTTFSVSSFNAVCVFLNLSKTATYSVSDPNYFSLKEFRMAVISFPEVSNLCSNALFP